MRNGVALLLRCKSSPFPVVTNTRTPAPARRLKRDTAALLAIQMRAMGLSDGSDPAKYAGKQIHEIHPVKFGGSPTDPANKIALTPAEHAKYTTFWNRLMKDLQ